MDPSQPLRAFVALPLPRAFQEALGALTPELIRIAPARLAVTRPGSWHLTLKFLGDVPRQGETGLPGLCAALAAIDWTGFDLAPGGGGFFPDPGRPRVIYAGLRQGAAACRELAGRVDAALAALGYPPEKRAFTPHLTLARVKDAPARADFRDVAGLLARTGWPVCRVERFVLYHSVLGPGGARYAELGSFPARGAAEAG